MEWSIVAKREKFTPWNGLLSLRGRNSLHGMVYYRQEGDIHSMEWSIIAKREKFTPRNGLLSLRGSNSLHGMVYYR
jgi:hypothetical protein